MIKKLLLVALFTLISASFYAQTTAFAYIKDLSGKPIENVNVDLAQSNNDVTADKIGYFQLVDLKPGHFVLTISKAGYEAKTLEFDVTADEKKKDLGTITLNFANTSSSEAGVVLIDDSSEGEEGNTSMQPTVGLLSSGRDAFANVAAFELGAYWFRPRGVENRYEDVLFNGVSMSKNDDGKVDFGDWGGLNDVTRYPMENVENITPSEYAFGNLGGLVYYNTRASSYRKGVSLAYSFTNRSYFHRAMATYSSGLSKKGWAFTFSASRRWADSGVIDGTYQDSYAYFGAIEKKFNDNHSLNLTAFGAPSYRSTNSPNTQEVYDLMGKNYNAYWGWQDGEKRNSRIRRTFEPIFMLADYWKINKKTNWNNTVSYQFGSDARSRLDWFHENDPTPTYYRNLPSYFAELYGLTEPTSEGGTAITEAEQARIDAFAQQWRTDESLSQINWERLYTANYNNKEIGARYTVVEDVNKDKTFNFASHLDTKLQDNWKLNVNYNFQILNSDNFRRVKDLLGADYANNLDNFGNNGLYNMNDTNTRVGVGDRIYYSFNLQRYSYNWNVSTEVDLRKWNIVASVFTSYSQSQRDGKFKNHFYQDTSFGKSDIYNAFDAGVKGRITYKINGKNFIVYNGAYFSLAPTLNEIYINPRVTDLLTPGLEDQIINSNDLSYIVRGQVLKLRLTGFYTTISKATDISRYYADFNAGSSSSGGSLNNTNALITEVVSGVDKRYVGGELGIDWKLTPTFNVVGVASVGEYKITNNPLVYSASDVTSIQSYGEAKLKGYKVAGTPQKAFSLGFRYNSPKFWWFGASGNYLMDQYLDFSAINRTSIFYTNTSSTYGNGQPYINPETSQPVTQEEVDTLLSQKKLSDQFMLNANAGKSFLFGKYRMGISLSVNNVLNNRNYVTGGYEQGRAANFIEAQADAQRQYPWFAPKLWYDKGRTYFANIYLRF